MSNDQKQITVDQLALWNASNEPTLPTPTRIVTKSKLTTKDHKDDSVMGIHADLEAQVRG